MIMPCEIEIEKVTLALALAALLGASHVRADSEAIALEDPETEYARAAAELNNIQNQLEASKHLAQRAGLGPQTVPGQRAYQAAREYFRQGEYLSTIRELNNYLNLSQIPRAGPYLYAQKMLGDAYLKSGFKHRAARAYFRYLSGFLTAQQPNYGDLLEVLRQLVPLVLAESGSDGRDLNALLAAIASLDLPEDIRSSALFMAAKAATNAGVSQIAQSWLELSATLGTNEITKAKSSYLTALIHLQNERLDAAKAALGLAMAKSPDQSIRDMATLALARVAVRERKATTALKYYEMIEEDSPVFRQSLFESIYLHTELRQDKQARSKTAMFLAKFPAHADTRQLRSLLTYLDLRVGDGRAAEASMKNAEHRLQEIRRWMQKNLAGQSHLRHEQLAALMTLSTGHIQPRQLTSDAYRLFNRIAELKRRLSDLRSEIRGTNLILGRAELEHLNPVWVNRVENLAGIIESLLTTGHRMVAVERHLYADNIDPVTLQKLVASERRRASLQTAGAAIRRKVAQWQDYVQFMTHSERVAKQYSRLQTMQAELAAARFHRVVDSEVAEKLKRRLALAMTDQYRALEVVRKAKVESLASRGPHTVLQEFLSNYATPLNEEAHLLSRIRERSKSKSTQLLAEEADRHWRHWQYLAKLAYRELVFLSKDIKTGVTGIVAELESHRHAYRDHSKQLALLQRGLEAELGDSVREIYSGLMRDIDTRIARHEKWRADLEWLGFSSLKQRSLHLKQKEKLEKQILRDNLKDLEYGAVLR